MTELVVLPDAAQLVRPAAQWLAREVTAAIAERGSCALCLAGGRTPDPVYRALAALPGISWAEVDLFFCDERGVPPDHPDSNYYMVQQALLSQVSIPPARVHRMEAERLDRDGAADEYAALLPRQLDVILLGIGQDGHTASLFPGSPVLEEHRRLVVPVLGAKPPAQRMTITPPVIAAARRVAVLVTGLDKAAMVARAIEGHLATKEIPAQLARRGTWFLDQAAASHLTRRKVPE
jgi:6-phosphogluconolactonase